MARQSYVGFTITCTLSLLLHCAIWVSVDLQIEIVRSCPLIHISDSRASLLANKLAQCESNFSQLGLAALQVEGAIYVCNKELSLLLAETMW